MFGRLAALFLLFIFLAASAGCAANADGDEQGVSGQKILQSFYYTTLSKTDKLAESKGEKVELVYGITARVFADGSSPIFDEIIDSFIYLQGNGILTWRGNHASEIHKSNATKAVLIGSGNAYVAVKEQEKPFIRELEKSGFKFSGRNKDGQKVYYKWYEINYDFQLD